MCTRGSDRALLRGPSTSPLDAMRSADPERPRTRRLVLAYFLLAAYLCAGIGVYFFVLWQLPRSLTTPGALTFPHFAFRMLLRPALLVAVALPLTWLWYKLVTTFLSDYEVRRLWFFGASRND